MTNFDVIVQTLSDVSGQPTEYVATALSVFFMVVGCNAQWLFQEIPDDEAQEMLRKLREEHPGIRNWLLEGRRRAEEKLRRRLGL